MSNASQFRLISELRIIWLEDLRLTVGMEPLLAIEKITDAIAVEQEKLEEYDAITKRKDLPSATTPRTGRLAPGCL